MGILDRLLGRKDDSASATATATEDKPVETACPHGTLVARWDDPADLGNNERVSRYLCEACGATLSREEGERSMSKAADVLRIDEGLRKTTEEETAKAE
jgi:hypothetical protein